MAFENDMRFQVQERFWQMSPSLNQDIAPFASGGRVLSFEMLSGYAEFWSGTRCIDEGAS